MSTTPTQTPPLAATTSTTTSSSSSNPSHQRLEAALTDFIDAIASDRRMQVQPAAPANQAVGVGGRHPALYHVWDFACRTRYVLSELDNVAAGRPVKHPEQIQGYDKAKDGGKPNPTKAKQLMADVTMRSMMLEMLLSPTSPSRLAMMGLPDTDFGEDLRAKAAAVTEAALASGPPV